MNYINNRLIEIIEQKTTTIEWKDEWDVDEIADNLIKYKHVMIRADVPGAGKSYAAKRLRYRGYNEEKIVVVCPTNALAQDNENMGRTTNGFFGLSTIDEEKIQKMNPDDLDIIILDEIYMLNIRKLVKIKQLCEAYPDKIIIATGDTSQLEPINEFSNNKEYKTYSNHCIDSIFPYNILLHENKRCKTK